MTDAVVEAIRSGKPVLLPTDTVYGLSADPYRREPAERVQRLKGREEGQPMALLAADVDMLLECVPELRGRSATIARAVLPGPYTLVLSNPARRFRWLTGSRPDTIGVRVPELPAAAAAVVAAVGCVLATSANRTGGPDPRTLDEVPPEIREGSGAEIDAGPLPGTPSTVIDFTGPEPTVIREGAGDVRAAIHAALGSVR
jgi:L-threonylcarbamoyladenylate synthase